MPWVRDEVACAMAEHVRYTPILTLHISCAGIQDMLQRVAGEKGMVWEEFLERLKKNGQWRVEVY